MIRGGGFLTLASLIVQVEPLPTCLHTLTLMEEEPTRTGGALGYCGTPARGTGAVAGWEGGKQEN